MSVNEQGSTYEKGNLKYRYVIFKINYISIYLPEYLISTIFSHVENTRHTYIQRKKTINNPSSVVPSLPLITHSVTPLTGSIPPSVHKIVTAIFEHTKVGQEGGYELSIQVSKLKFNLF